MTAFRHWLTPFIGWLSAADIFCFHCFSSFRHQVHSPVFIGIVFFQCGKEGRSDSSPARSSPDQRGRVWSDRFWIFGEDVFFWSCWQHSLAGREIERVVCVCVCWNVWICTLMCMCSSVCEHVIIILSATFKSRSSAWVWTSLLLNAEHYSEVLFIYKWDTCIYND